METLFEIALTALVLFAILKEEKLIALEDKVLDFFAWCCAWVIYGVRYAKWWVGGVKR